MMLVSFLVIGPHGAAFLLSAGARPAPPRSCACPIAGWRRCSCACAGLRRTAGLLPGLRLHGLRRLPAGQPRWRCKACRRDVSITSDTLFAWHKLPLRSYRLAVAAFCNGVKGKSALALSRDLDVQLARRRVRTGKRGQPRLLRPVQLARIHARTWLGQQGRLQPVLDKALAHPPDDTHADPERLGDRRIRPAWPPSDASACSKTRAWVSLRASALPREVTRPSSSRSSVVSVTRCRLVIPASCRQPLPPEIGPETAKATLTKQ